MQDHSNKASRCYILIPLKHSLAPPIVTVRMLTVAKICFIQILEIILKLLLIGQACF